MKTRSSIVRGLILASAFITFAVLIVLVGYIVLKGVPHLNPAMFEKTYTTENVSMFPAIITTLIVVVLSF